MRKFPIIVGVGLIAITIVLLIWAAPLWSEYRIEQAAVKQLGTDVRVEYLDSRRGSLLVPPFPIVRRVFSVTTSRKNGFTNGLSDDHCRNIADLTFLQTVDLSYSKITEKTLVRLKSLELLTGLYLIQTDVDDADMVHLRDLGRLKDLQLAGTRISSSGIKILAELPDLEFLDICATSVDDTAIPFLQQFKSLSLLSMENSKITAEGRKRLQSNMPSLTIVGHGNR